MATKTLQLDIVSAEKSIYSGRVQQLSVDGQEGGLGIFPGHTPLLTGIKPGEVLLVHENGNKEVFYVSGGLLEVQPEITTILADTVVRADDIDEQAAEEALEKAKQHLEESKKSKIDYEQALLQLQEASARLRVVKDLNKFIKHNRIG